MRLLVIFSVGGRENDTEIAGTVSTIVGADRAEIGDLGDGKLVGLIRLVPVQEHILALVLKQRVVRSKLF